jgi:ribosomal protein S18 acetylase RimI-like enzyme
LPNLTRNVAVVDLDPADDEAVIAAADLLAQSVHESIQGLVPYHASGYARYMEAALQPPATIRTVVIRIIDVNGVPVGAADWRIQPGMLFLNGIAVAESARGKGLARRLMTDGLHMARRLGLPRLGLDVVVDNHIAMSFYQRMGFVVTGESYWHDSNTDDDGGKAPPARAVDWPTFRAHLAAYGFGDLTLRGEVEETTRIRQVNRTLRVGASKAQAQVQMLKKVLEVTRIVSVTTDSAFRADKLLSRSARMVRNVS